MKKILTVVGTRPEIIKMSSIIKKLDNLTEQKIVFTGQNFSKSLSEVFFTDFKIRKPDYTIDIKNESTIDQISNILRKVDKIIEKFQPDAFLIYGDTNSCLTAYCAKRRKVPIFHFEGGNRCYDLRVPEEINRKIIDHLSDYNYVLSEHARRNLIREGIREDRIIKTGSHLLEVLNDNKSSIKASNILKKLNLNKNSFIVLSAHREENVDNQNLLKKLLNQIETISKDFNKKIIFSTHPRTMKNIQKISPKLYPSIAFLEPMGYFDYLKLQINSFCTISDSGTLTEEASLLGFSGIMIRRSHERMEGEDVPLLLHSPIEENDLALNIKLLKKIRCNNNLDFNISDYNNANVSDQVSMSIINNISKVNNYTWFKNSEYSDY